jgi:hypothetical protein
MSFQVRLLLTAALAVSLAALCSAKNKQLSQSTYVITNDDGINHSYASFYVAGGTQGAPTLTFSNNVNTGGLGIAGGFFGTPRINMLPDASAQCVYASNGSTGDISAINIQTQVLSGPFAASGTDIGDANGIGVVVGTNYLYAGYSTSNTIATFAVQSGCSLSFLGDTTVAGLNGGSVAGMALRGNMLVVAYEDGSIESFNTANGIPVSNGDAQNSTGYLNALSNFPDGVDITQDGHFAIFGDSSIAATVEVSDISSGHLTTTKQYTLTGDKNAVAAVANSGFVRLSPDETLIYMANSDGGSISAGFFDKTTGKVSGGCFSPALAGYYNPWAFTGSLATRDTTGTGGVLYVAEYGYVGSFIGIVNISSNGSTCSLTESSASEIPDTLSDGLLSITVYPPRSF